MSEQSTRVPDLGELRELRAAALAGGKVYANVAHLVELLERLRLTCFLDARGDFWIGTAAIDFIEHARWLYMVRGEDLAQAGDWNECDFYAVAHCGTRLYRQGWALGGLGLELSDLNVAVQWALRDNGAPDDQWAAYIRRAHVAYATFGFLGVEVPELFGLDWNQEQHDLLCHFPEWLAEHPEAENLPRDLVLRAHGLGYYANGLANGLDMLDTAGDGQHA